MESPDGNPYKLVGCETSSGVGACVGLPVRKSQSMLRGVHIILARIRLEHQYNDNVPVRFHSDIEKSFLGDVYAYIEDKAWLKTTSEGYDSNGNSIVERRNKKLNQALSSPEGDADCCYRG